MANSTSATTPPNSTNANTTNPTPFRLLDLPAELREHIYLHTMLPLPAINTASIPSTPDYTTIPPIAQVPRTTPNDALAVYYRARPIELSLHCAASVGRTQAWIRAAQPERSRTFTLGGKLMACGGDFYILTVTCLGLKAPFYDVKVWPVADGLKEVVLGSLKEKVEGVLEGFGTEVGEGAKGVLSSGQLGRLVEVVRIETMAGRREDGWKLMARERNETRL